MTTVMVVAVAGQLLPELFLFQNSKRSLSIVLFTVVVVVAGVEVLVRVLVPHG